MTPKRIAGAAAGTAIGLGLASAAYQAGGEARDRRRHPPPGRLVDVGGYRLHIRCAGTGGPPVIICPALGATVEEWREVQQRIAEETTVCVYDRAGLGYSDSPRKHRTVKRMAGELHALLRGAGIEPPYVLAGHSIGGLIARVFITLYPAEVVGLVLIEASHPEMGKRLPAAHITHHRSGRPLYVALERMRPLGLQRMALDLSFRKDSPVTSRQRRADGAEMLALTAICRDTAATAGDLGDLPVMVLTSSDWGSARDAGMAQERAHARYRAWVTLQDELAGLSTNTTHVTADHGGHHLNRDNPELVAHAITDLVERVRSAVR